MFDTHCHLNLQPLYQNYERHIAAAKESGITSIVVPGMDIESSKASVRMVAEFTKVYSAIGIHPTEELGDLDLSKTIYQLEELVTDNVVAIGEIGLDYYKYKSSPDVQKQWLAEQIILANKLGLAVVIHNRHAGDDLLEVFNENWSSAMRRRVVFHCCEADDQLLKFAKKYEVYIGVCGDVTYDTEKQEFVKNIPLDLMVVETDSPNLTPEPVRTESKFPNKPENLVHIVEFVADLINVEQNKFENISTNNAERLFGLSS